MGRRGFTIIELLVVIGILALLMGLTLGGIAASRKTDKLLATEQMVAGSIRQARHTARTGGSPVMLEISKGERRISGVTRVSVAQEGFDGAASSLLDGSSFQSVPGAGGQGAAPKDLSAGGVPDYGVPELRLPRDKRLRRSATGAVGFYLSCMVRPPLVQNANGNRFPLILIGENDLGPQENPPTPLDPSVSDPLTAAIAGIHLRRLTIVEQEEGAMRPLLDTWEIIGWVNNEVWSDSVPDSDNPFAVSSMSPRNEPDLHPSSPVPDVAWPMAGGDWEEIGLLYDGERRLVLYRNGVVVGERLIPVGISLPTFTEERVIVGRMRWDDDLGNEVIAFAENAAFDDIAIFRLATADAGRFPSGVEPTNDRRIIAHPDGRVQIEPIGPLVFAGTFGAAAAAEIHVTSNGAVSSQIVISP